METAQFFHFKGLTFFCFLFPPSSFSEAVAKWIEIIAVTFFIGYFQPLWGSSFLVVRLSVAPCKAGGKACCFSRTNHLGMYTCGRLKSRKAGLPVLKAEALRGREYLSRDKCLGQEWEGRGLPPVSWQGSQRGMAHGFSRQTECSSVPSPDTV